MIARSRSVLLAAISLIACSPPTPAAPPATSVALASGTRSPIEDARGTLAQGRVTRASAGPLYVSLVATDLARTGALTEDHEPGFELVVAGSEALDIGGNRSTLASGRAAFVPATGHTHQAATPAESYFISLRPSSERGRSLPPGRQVLYDSADLPPAATPAGGYDDVLVLLVLAPGQVVPPHMHGGVEPMYVIEGTIELRVKGRPVTRLGPGAGDTVLPDTALLVTNVGPTIARVLVMLATPDGKPAQTAADPP